MKSLEELAPKQLNDNSFYIPLSTGFILCVDFDSVDEVSVQVLKGNVDDGFFPASDLKIGSKDEMKEHIVAVHGGWSFLWG